MKQRPFLQCASVILILAVSLLSFADDDDDSDDNDGGPLTSEITGDTREFTLDLNVVEDYEIRPGVPAEGGGDDLSPALVDLWAYACRFASGAVVPNCGPGADPTLPGPFLHVAMGDLVRVTFDNSHDKPHTIHLHGYHRNNVDGVHPVPPHENFLIEFVANPCGTYVYHCHINTPLHQDRGMYGQFVVDCPNPVPDSGVVREFLLVVDEQPRDWPALGDDPFPETHEYIINGKSFVPDIDVKHNLRTILGDGTVEQGPMVVDTGDTVIFRISNFGMATHEMELVGPVGPASMPLSFPLPFPLTVHDTEVRQGSNPVLVRPASIPEPPPELVTNHSLILTFTAGPTGIYLFRSTNPVERRNYEVLTDGTLRMGKPDQGGMQTILVVN